MSYIRLPFPVLHPFPGLLSDDLNKSITEHRQLEDLGEQRTRNSSEAIVKRWREPWLQRWLQSNEKRKAILEWLAEAIFKDDLNDIPEFDAMNLFLSLHVLVSYGQIELAEKELAAWQRFLALNYPDRQRNLVLDMINQVEDELYEPEPDTNPLSSGPEEESELVKCWRWNQVLQFNLLNKDQTEMEFEKAQRTVALTIQQMKKLKASIYRSPEFVEALSKSGLAHTILELADPSYGYRHYQDPHHARLLRLHGFGLVLADVLDKWTPKAWSKEVEQDRNNKTIPRFNTANTKKLIKGQDLFRAFRKEPHMIPSSSNPSAVFFLCSYENFSYAWNRWLAWFLDAAGYQVHDVNVHQLYSDSIRYLKVLRNNSTNFQSAKANWDAKLMEIIKRTLQLKDIVDETKDYAFDRQVKHCSKCIHLTPNKRCVQRIDVTLSEDPTFVTRWRGVGVTCVPKEQQMKPRKSRKVSKATELVHPDDIGLRGIDADDEVLERCGKHIFLFFEGDELADFAWYNAFSDGIFARLVSHSRTISGVQPVSRGAKFSHWESGQMFPFGAREAMGGRRADHYAFYAGIEAETLHGISVLFDHAEVSAVILQTARAVHPDLVTKIKEASAACDRVGLFGVNLFDCYGYTAPQHADDDSVRSLSSQFELRAKSEWSEFAFCVTQYGYFLKTRENMLWSFESRFLHGTMLPSEDTVMHLCGGLGDRASVGAHITNRRRDQRRANHNEEIRRNYNLRERIWWNRP